MRRGAWIAGVLLLAAAVWPEIGRYRAERSLRRASTSLLRVLTTPLSPEDATKGLEVSAEAALAAMPRLPDDPRPCIVAGSARLVAGRLEEAVASYREGLRRSERAEIDLNIGRTHAAAGDAEAARVGYVRAGWISPPLLAAISGEARAQVDAEIARLEGLLKSRTLAAPPPPPH
jgi:tetratricopeptide (TPR) repeat protein